MKLSMERLPESRVLLDIAADEDEFATAMDRAYRKVTKQIAVPGFRRGKAPRAMIERLYGREVFLEEANKELMTDLYRRALEQERLVPVGEPEVDLVSPEPLGFKVTLPVYPTIDPAGYADVRVDPVDATVPADEVDAVIEQMRRSNSPWVDPPEGALEVGPDRVLSRAVRHPREGDQVTLDYTVREGEEPYREPVKDAVFVLGESNLFAALRERIEQLAVGETSTFDVAFAPDDESVDPDLRGKTMTYTVTLTGLKERELLPIDDDFARDVAEVETLVDLRQEIHDDLHQGKTAEARTEVVNRIVEAMAEGAAIELPAPMVDEAVTEDLTGFRTQLAQRRLTLEEYLRLRQQTDEELRAELRPTAARRLRNSLLLREIAKREGTTVAEADLDAEVARLTAAAAGGTDPERVQRLYGSDYFRGVLRTDLFERRLTDRLIAIATDGRGAVTNGWVEPEPVAATTADPAPTEPGTAEPPPSPTTGATAEVVTSAAGDREPDPTLSVAEAHAEEAAADGAQPAPLVADSLAEALTLGTMPGQPGDLAEAPFPAAGGTPVGAAEANAAPAQAPVEAPTPEEREAQGEPGQGGSLPNPTY